MAVRTLKIIVVLALALPFSLAACGEDDAELAADTTETAMTSAEPSVPDGDPLLMALEALTPDFDGAKSCFGDAPPEVVDRSQENLLSGVEWHGQKAPVAGDVRPVKAWNADFCLPAEPNHTQTRVYLDILEFTSANDASAWVEDLRAATAAGQPVVRGEDPQPVGCRADNHKTAKLADESVAGEDAVDVVIHDPCGNDRDFPGKLHWEPETYSFAAAGRYVVSVYVQQQSGRVNASNGQMTIQGLVERITVLRDKQAAAVATLTEELADVG